MYIAEIYRRGTIFLLLQTPDFTSRCCVTVVQGYSKLYRNWYQSKARRRFPISLPL